MIMIGAFLGFLVSIVVTVLCIGFFCGLVAWALELFGVIEKEN
jgi:hypothetical protein